MQRDPLAAAREIGPLIRAERHRTESERRLSAPIVDQLVRQRLFRLSLEEELGGLACTGVQTLEVYEALASAEASVAWIAWNTALVCFYTRPMNPALRREIFADPARLFAQSTQPSGRAVRDGDAYRISGRWRLVSGCDLAHTLFLHCTLEHEGVPQLGADGSPLTRFFFVEQRDYEIIDTWHVGGLRGTGSHDVVVEGARVATEFSASPEEVPRNANHPLGRVPIHPNIAAAFGAQTLGVAQTALDTIVELAHTKVTPGPLQDLRDRPPAQAAVAAQGAALSAARSHLHSSADRLWDSALKAAPATLDAMAEVYAAALHAVEVARVTVDTMYALGGTSSLYVDCPLERAHRDLHAMLRHIVAQPVWLEDAGRVRFGLEPALPIFAV